MLKCRTFVIQAKTTSGIARFLSMKGEKIQIITKVLKEICLK